VIRAIFLRIGQKEKTNFTFGQSKFDAKKIFFLTHLEKNYLLFIRKRSLKDSYKSSRQAEACHNSLTINGGMQMAVKKKAKKKAKKKVAKKKKKVAKKKKK
jgi:hypothetical protein